MFQTLQRFVAYGCLGILVEVLFTGLRSLYRRNWSATSTTHLWMAPIYGLGGWLLELTHYYINCNVLVITEIYVIEIYLIEFCSGWAIKKLIGRCPWDYGVGRFTIMGLIRLDYWPFWYVLAFAAHFLHPYLFKVVNVLSRI
jgi:uncharacterized membrane protein